MDRFWNKVNKTEGCWLWTGSKTLGYGKFKTPEGTVLAHRWAYENARGLIPAGQVVDHLCKVKSCVNPDHLEAVEHSENVRRGKGRPRGPGRPRLIRTKDAEGHWTHCVNEHEMSGTNVYVRPSGFRQCRRCAADRMARKARGGDSR